MVLQCFSPVKKVQVSKNCQKSPKQPILGYPVSLNIRNYLNTNKIIDIMILHTINVAVLFKTWRCPNSFQNGILLKKKTFLKKLFGKNYNNCYFEPFWTFSVHLGYLRRAYNIVGLCNSTAPLSFLLLMYISQTKRHKKPKIYYFRLSFLRTLNFEIELKLLLIKRCNRTNDMTLILRDFMKFLVQNMPKIAFFELLLAIFGYLEF